MPDTPSPPTTSVNGNYVDIVFTVPGDGSSPILGYKIEIRQFDGVFAEDKLTCDGYNSAIKSALRCSVPIATLVLSPYKLPWGAEVYARYSAINVVGASLPSAAGNGAKLLAQPNPPIDVTNIPEITSKS